MKKSRKELELIILKNIDFLEKQEINWFSHPEISSKEFIEAIRQYIERYREVIQTTKFLEDKDAEKFLNKLENPEPPINIKEDSQKLQQVSETILNDARQTHTKYCLSYAWPEEGAGYACKNYKTMEKELKRILLRAKYSDKITISKEKV